MSGSPSWSMHCKNKRVSLRIYFESRLATRTKTTTTMRRRSVQLISILRLRNIRRVRARQERCGWRRNCEKCLSAWSKQNDNERLMFHSLGSNSLFDQHERVLVSPSLFLLSSRLVSDWPRAKTRYLLLQWKSMRRGEKSTTTTRWLCLAEF